MVKMLNFLTVAVLFGALVFMVKTYLDRPEMRVSEKGDCLSVMGPSGAKLCAEVKKSDWGKYDQVLVYDVEPN